MDREVKYRFFSKKDYNIVAGPDWPSYEQFQLHYNVPDFVYKEVDEMLWHQPPFDDPAFCVLPFYGIEYPTKTPCCLLAPEHDLDQVKNDMLAGIRTSACRHCWTNEDNNIKSDRLIKNETLSFYTNQDLIKIYNDAKNNLNKIVHYKKRCVTKFQV